MVQIFKNVNRNRIGIFSISFIVAVIGYSQYKTMGELALINVILGSGLAFFEFVDILILHSKVFRDFMRKTPILRFLKKYEICVADDYILCRKGKIQIVETNNFSAIRNAMLFFLPDGNGNMIHGKYFVSSEEGKIYVYTDRKMNNIDEERALLKII